RLLRRRAAVELRRGFDDSDDPLRGRRRRGRAADRSAAVRAGPDRHPRLGRLRQAAQQAVRERPRQTAGAGALHPDSHAIRLPSRFPMSAIATIAEVKRPKGRGLLLSGTALAGAAALAAPALADPGATQLPDQAATTVNPAGTVTFDTSNANKLGVGLSQSR